MLEAKLKPKEPKEKPTTVEAVKPEEKKAP
jgi:hypothetical protein